LRRADPQPNSNPDADRYAHNFADAYRHRIRNCYTDPDRDSDGDFVAHHREL
jgi:hypothetical protein